MTPVCLVVWVATLLAAATQALDLVPDFYHLPSQVHAKLRAEASLHNPYMTLYEASFTHANATQPLIAARLRSPSAGACALKVLIVCGMHGREPFSTEACMNFILTSLKLRLMRNSTFNAAHFDILVLPLLNPAGADAALSFDPCARTNERGVDLNRNFPCALPAAPNATFPEEENPGPAPFSEPQTAFLRSLVLGPGPDAWGVPDVALNIHTGAYSILYPHDAASVPVHFEKIHRYVASAMRMEVCPECSVGRGADMLYPSHGTLMDWVASLGNQTLSFTWELYYDPSAHDAGRCFASFNPVSRPVFVSHLQQWTRGFYLFLDIARALYRSPFTVFGRLRDANCPSISTTKLKALKRKYAVRA